MGRRNICKFVEPLAVEALSISCFVLESDPEVMKKPCSLQENCMILVIQGEGHFQFEDIKVPFETGSLIFGWAGECYVVESQTPCEYMYVRFSGERAQKLLRRFNIQENNRSFTGYDGLIPLWRDSLSRASEENIDLASESILLYTFSRLSGVARQRGSLVSEMLEITEEQFNDPELSIASLAETLGYNAKYLSHTFKDKMGIGYTEYLRNLRIKYAISLLDHGIDSVKNVALLSGFTDPLYFSTVFKKSVGVSPKEYKGI